MEAPVLPSGTISHSVGRPRRLHGCGSANSLIRVAARPPSGRVFSYHRLHANQVLPRRGILRRRAGMRALRLGAATAAIADGSLCRHGARRWSATQLSAGLHAHVCADADLRLDRHLCRRARRGRQLPQRVDLDGPTAVDPLEQSSTRASPAAASSGCRSSGAGSCSAPRPATSGWTSRSRRRRVDRPSHIALEQRAQPAPRHRQVRCGLGQHPRLLQGWLRHGATWTTARP